LACDKMGMIDIYHPSWGGVLNRFRAVIYWLAHEAHVAHVYSWSCMYILEGSPLRNPKTESDGCSHRLATFPLFCCYRNKTANNYFM
jgi:hypothetical protein